MNKENAIYTTLAQRLGAPGSQRFIKILEAMVTPDEGALLLELQRPTTAEQLAKKLNTDQKIIQSRLANLIEKGLARFGKDGYVSHPNIVMFHHAAHALIPEDRKPRIFPLWEDFFFSEWRDILVDSFEMRLATSGAKGHRVIPARKALLASPKIKPEQVLWYEDMAELLKRGKWITTTACGCRAIWAKCESPVEVCLHIDSERMEGMKGKRCDLKTLSFEDALALMDKCEDLGLVHIPLNIAKAETVCNCCDDCCMVINPLNYRGRVHAILSPSRYRAVVDQDLCNGCQTCVDRCKFDAIEMKKGPNSKKLKSTIINEHCMGCGVCVVACPQKALTMELIRPPDHIPIEMQMGR